MKSWYLIHTKIRQEQVALENLEHQGFECFLPQINVEKLRHSTLQVVQEALFPRYLFIRLDTSREGENWALIRSTVGVSRLVTFGNVPAKIADALVALICAQTQHNVVLRRHFEPGELVVFTEGPFAGLNDIYQTSDGEGRIILLLNILTKAVKISAAPTSLRKAN